MQALSYIFSRYLRKNEINIIYLILNNENYVNLEKCFT